MNLHSELTAALRLQSHFGTLAAAAYLNVRGWSLQSAMRVLL